MGLASATIYNPLNLIPNHIGAIIILPLHGNPLPPLKLGNLGAHFLERLNLSLHILGHHIILIIDCLLLEIFELANPIQSILIKLSLIPHILLLRGHLIAAQGHLLAEQAHTNEPHLIEDVILIDVVLVYVETQRRTGDVDWDVLQLPH